MKPLLPPDLGRLDCQGPPKSDARKTLLRDREITFQELDTDTTIIRQQNYEPEEYGGGKQ